jgi:hypothetical protein
LNILDYIRDVHPEVYERTKYRIIEISDQLANLQQQGLGQSAYARGHSDKVEIINRSIFDWSQYVSSPCYFLALEVFDNFAHDALKYDIETGDPYQSRVVIDPRGEFYEYYTRDLDPLAQQFLERRHAACKSYPHPLQGSRLMQNLRSLLPFRGTLSSPEYIPTRLMQFFYILYQKFPNHKLITSDFHKLSDAVEGLNAPVVQTRFKREMIPVSTPLVSHILVPLFAKHPVMMISKIKHSSSDGLRTTEEQNFKRLSLLSEIYIPLLLSRKLVVLSYLTSFSL